MLYFGLFQFELAEVVSNECLFIHLTSNWRRLLCSILVAADNFPELTVQQIFIRCGPIPPLLFGFNHRRVTY